MTRCQLFCTRKTVPQLYLFENNRTVIDKCPIFRRTSPGAPDLVKQPTDWMTSLAGQSGEGSRLQILLHLSLYRMPIHLAGRWQDFIYSQSVFYQAHWLTSMQTLLRVKAGRKSLARLPCLIVLNELPRRSLMGKSYQCHWRAGTTAAKPPWRPAKWEMRVAKSARCRDIKTVELSVVLKTLLPPLSTRWLPIVRHSPYGFVRCPLHLEPDVEPTSNNRISAKNFLTVVKNLCNSAHDNIKTFVDRYQYLAFSADREYWCKLFLSESICITCSSLNSQSTWTCGP